MGTGWPAFIIFNSLGAGVDKMDDWVYPGLGIGKINISIGWEYIWEEDYVKVFLCVPV